MIVLRVALAVPLHRVFDYLWQGESCPAVGHRVRVPLGSRECVGVVVEVVRESAVAAEQMKPALALLEDLPPLPPDFLVLCQFASTYYQSPFGEVVLQALPAGLKRPVAPSHGL